MHLVFWHWWILAAVLLIGEMLSFTSFLLWIAFLRLLLQEWLVGLCLL